MTNGIANPRPAVKLPITGQVTEPTRNAEVNSPATRPRASGGEIRILRPNDDKENIADPRPPSERNSSSCQYVSANAHAAVDNATISSPLMYTRRSPNRWMSRPAGGAPTSRISANAVMTNVAAAMVTPKLRAYCGNTGATTPYPMAMTAFAVTRTQTSAGSFGLAAGVTSQVASLLPSEAGQSASASELTLRLYWMTEFTTSLAACCTCARCSGPLNDSA